MGRVELSPTVEPRVYATGRAVVLLAVADASLAGRRYTVEGRRVVVVRFGRLSLALSYVDPVEYAPERLSAQREQVGWLRNEARLHERAVERAGAVAVLPAPLLSVYADPSELERAAKSRYARWCRTLAPVGKRREYVVHAFTGPHAPPGGEPYLLRVSARVLRGSGRALKGEPEIVELLTALGQSCAGGARATRRIASNRARGHRFAAALLLDDTELAALKPRLSTHAQAGAPLGLSLYLEGPRAPFSFI